MTHLLLLATHPQHVDAAGFILRVIKGLFVAVGSKTAAILCAINAKTKAPARSCSASWA